MPIVVLLELLSVPSTSAPSSVISNIPPLCCSVTINFTSLYRISVPVCATQKKKNVPYQMLLLLEKMQCGKQKAVSPKELALCLEAHRVTSKHALSHAHLCLQTENVSYQALESSADLGISFRGSEMQEVGTWWCSALYNYLPVMSEVLCLASDLVRWCPKDANMISMLEDSAVDTGQSERAVRDIEWMAYGSVCLAILL